MYKKNDRAIGDLFHTNGDEHHRDDKKASYLFQKIYLANIFSIYLAPLISWAPHLTQRAEHTHHYERNNQGND